MLKSIGNWFEQRRMKAIAAQKTRGYDYAAGCLLRGGKPSELERYYGTSETFGEGEFEKAFDRGMIEATNRAVELGIVVDDRVH